MKFTPKIRIDTGVVEGYGGPGYSWIRVTHHNLLLEEARVGSERDLGRKEAEFAARWDREWDKSDFDAAVTGKKEASARCDSCGGDTLDGQISCVGKIFCRSCEKAGAIEAAKLEYHKRTDDHQKQRQKAESARQEEVTAKTRATLYGAFHWRDGWHFKRLSDGAVRVMRPAIIHGGGEEYLKTDITIPSNEWASIVCSVSSGGETGERWNAAQDFHGRPSASPVSRPHRGGAAK